MTSEFLSTPYDDSADYPSCQVQDVEGADGSASHRSRDDLDICVSMLPGLVYLCMIMHITHL